MANLPLGLGRAISGVRKDIDLSSGHGSFAPTTPNEGSDDVFFNSFSAHRMFDGWNQHCVSYSCHSGNTMLGSTTVFINGIGASTIGDPISCGGTIVTGSQNVFIGGKSDTGSFTILE